MKIVRTIILIFMVTGSLAMPIFFLIVRHYQMETEAAHWIASILPGWEIPLETKRSVADMAVTYGELGAQSMLAYSAVFWCGAYIYARFLKRDAKGKDEARGAQGTGCG